MRSPSLRAERAQQWPQLALDNVGPDHGGVTSGDGDDDRGRALHRGDESGPDFIVFLTTRK